MKTPEEIQPNYAPVYAAALYPKLCKLFQEHGKECKEWVRNITKDTPGFIVNIKHLVESRSSKCMICGKVDDVILQVIEKEGKNE